MNSNLFNELQHCIDKAELEGKPIDGYVKEQIQLLQEAHDEFLAMAQAQGYDLQNLRVGEIEVEQYTAMKQLAQKIGLPTEEYDDAIKNIRIRILGIEAYKTFFE